jgi:PAS domain S-box-containing protein
MSEGASVRELGDRSNAEPLSETDWARQARASRALFRAIAEQSPILIWRSGVDTQCDYFNQRWLDFTGRSLEQEQGEGWAEGVHPDDLERCVEIYLSSFHRREPFEMEYRLRRHDGEYRWILDRGGPYSDGDGEFLGYIGSCIDIHERKELEAELLRANRARDEFLAVLSHELRTPLQPILTTAQTLLLRYRDDPRLQRGLTLIERNTRRQARLVEDLLDISRMMREGIPLERAPVDLVRVVEQCVEGMRGMAAEHRHEIVVQPSGEPLWVSGDRRRLEQVIDNLLENAVKYTEPGGRIVVSTAVHEAYDLAAAGMCSKDPLLGRGDRQAVVRIEDNGIGIDPTELHRIFELFTQADGTLRRSRGGLGLGLAIVRSLVERHGGSVVAESAGPGRGSRFTLRFPLAPPEGEPEVSPSDPAIAQRASR